MFEKRVLLVGYDKTSANRVSQRFGRMGIQVRVVHDDRDALQLANEWWPEVIVLDTQAVDTQALNLCRSLRVARYCGVLLVYSGRETPLDVVITHEAGADDYVSKTDEPTVIDAKVRRGLQRRQDCSLCRSRSITQPPRDFPEGTIGRKVVPRTLTQDLTRLEEQLLELLLSEPSNIVPQAILLQAGWGNRGRCPRLLHDAISRLREKVKPLGWVVVNIRGLGYRLDLPDKISTAEHCSAVCNGPRNTSQLTELSFPGERPPASSRQNLSNLVNAEA